MSQEDRMNLIERLTREFHETYERLAPGFNYRTREASAVPWDDVPEQNKALMRAVVAHVMAGAEEDLRDAIGLLARARCTDLSTNDKSWWRARRASLTRKWGQ